MSMHVQPFKADGLELQKNAVAVSSRKTKRAGRINAGERADTSAIPFYTTDNAKETFDM